MWHLLRGPDKFRVGNDQLQPKYRVKLHKGLWGLNMLNFKEQNNFNNGKEQECFSRCSKIHTYFKEQNNAREIRDKKVKEWK